MKLTFAAHTVLVIGLLVLITSCQQTNKAESKSGWQLSSPPATAAGYGESPLDTQNIKDPAPAPPADENLKQETPPTIKEPKPEEPATEGNGQRSSSPAMIILPPPSAAGYGSPSLQANDEQGAVTDHQAGDASQPEAAPTAGGAVSQQPPTMGGLPTSSWKIEPPPSAAGYGSRPGN